MITLGDMGDSNSPLYNPEAVCVFSASIHMRKYVMAAGGIYDKTQNWAVRYEEGDPKGPIPIFTLVCSTITPSIKASLKARIEKQREASFPVAT